MPKPQMYAKIKGPVRAGALIPRPGHHPRHMAFYNLDERCVEHYEHEKQQRVRLSKPLRAMPFDAVVPWDAHHQSLVMRGSVELVAGPGRDPKDLPEATKIEPANTSARRHAAKQAKVSKPESQPARLKKGASK